MNDGTAGAGRSSERGAPSSPPNRRAGADPSRRRSAHGFTLIELLVVVVILGAGMAFVAVKLDGLLPRTRLQSAARTIGRNAALLRNYAITSGVPHTMEYDLDAGRFRGRRQSTEEDANPDDPALEAFAWTALPTGVRMHDVAFSDDEAHDGGLVPVVFEPNGSTAHHMVHLELEGTDRRFTVEVSPLLGRVDLLPEWLEFEPVSDADFPQ